MKKNYMTFNKMLLFTAGEYLTHAINEGLTRDPFHASIVDGINSYKVLCKFNEYEYEKVVRFSDTDTAKKVVESEFSHIIFALELLKQWVEQIPREHRKHVYLGVSNKKLVKGRSSFALEMIELKRADKIKHAEAREIIDDGVLKGKHFFSQALDFFTDETK